MAKLPDLMLPQRHNMRDKYGSIRRKYFHLIPSPDPDHGPVGCHEDSISNHFIPLLRVRGDVSYVEIRGVS